jgi:nicotinamide/nicotinate riboside kinase
MTLTIPSLRYLPTSIVMPPKTILLALSGPSCSGKTTLARLLRSTLAPHAFILHEDDFYKTDADIPVKKVIVDGKPQELQDWDCLESVDLDLLLGMLEFVKAEGRVKIKEEGFEGKEDKNEIGNVDVDMSIVKTWTERFGKLFTDLYSQQEVKIAIVDGFLLYSEEMAKVREAFDLKLLLRTSYNTVKRRRESRKGYVTLEGFWEDPEGYVDAIVWPNYVQDHAFLFQDGNVEGELDRDVCRTLGIQAMEGTVEEDMTSVFGWACGILEKKLNEKE